MVATVLQRSPPPIGSRRTPTGSISAGFVTIEGAAEVGALMLPYAQLAARTIAERLLDGATAVDRALVEQFLRARRNARGPILAINGREVLVNAAAARLVNPGDHATVRSWASELLARDDGSSHDLHLRARIVTGRCEPIRVGSELVGALVHFDEKAATPKADSRRRARDRGHPTRGWSSLRSIFRKLDTRSRVELARVVVVSQGALGG